MHIVAVICSNGLGHYRRTVGLLSRLQERLPEARIDVICESWQRDRTSNWERGSHFWERGARLIDAVTAPGVHWSTEASTYRDGRLMAWERRLSDVRALREADLVLSDNLAGVLTVRPDACLM